jgi:competence protein ComEA
LALAGVVVFQFLRPEPAGVILTSPTSIPSPPAAATPSPLRVYVSGAVQAPDVYFFSPDSIVKDALVAAGGATADADLDRINLALPLADGQHIYVPHIDEENPPVDLPGNAPAGSGKININTANAAELETLPAIGPSIAQRICDYREAHGPGPRTS